MAYIKNTWVDREGTTRYFESVDEDGALIFTPDYTQVTELGTPVNADNMNHIEDGIAAGSFTKYDPFTVYQKDDLVTFIVDNEPKIYRSLTDNNVGNSLQNGTFWEEISLGGGGGAFNLFDTKLLDRVLSYKETKGWALQGTYVYKEAVAGSRYGYPDFYNKCVEEYAEATEMVGIPWVQPILTDDGVWGGSSFAVSASSYYDDKSKTWYAFDGNTTDTNKWFSAKTGEKWIAFYNPKALNVTSLTVYNHITNTYYLTSGSVQASTDGDDWVTLTTFTQSARTDSFEINLTSNKNYYKYYRLANLTSNGSGGEVWVRELKITATQKSDIRKNPNGHLFYDIADKAQIDELYNTNGIAWYYGIDTDNERVFLPRTKWFIQPTGEITEVNSVNEAGLPNITGGTNGYSNKNVYGAFKINNNVFSSGSGGDGFSAHDFDASRSNPIYGNSDTVQPPSINQLLYICVGNTNVESAVTDVVDVTTTENDTVPLFTGMYFDFTPNNVSWLKAGEQANSGGIYTFTYNELVNVLNGETKYGDLKVIDVADMVAGEDYSLYWKVNQTDMTFITPTAISNKALSGGVMGNGMTLGLTNGIANFGLGVYESSDTGNTRLFGTSRYGTAISSSSQQSSGILGQFGVTTDSTKSGIIAEEATSQLYFKVANAVQNLELLDAGEVLEVLSTKTDKLQACEASFPSSKYIDLTLGANGASYTAPANGWYYINCTSSSTSGFTQLINNTSSIISSEQTNLNNRPMRVYIPCLKGDSVSAYYENTSSQKLRFIYAQGEV